MKRGEKRVFRRQYRITPYRMDYFRSLAFYHDSKLYVWYNVHNSDFSLVWVYAIFCVPQKRMKKTTVFLPFVVGITLFVGGGLPWISREIVYILGILAGVFLILTTPFLKGKLVFPETFRIYLLFLLLFSVSIFWSLDREVSFEHLLLFVGGGLFWLSSFNLKKERIPWFLNLIVFLGLFFLTLFLILWFSGDRTFLSWSLIYPATANHLHIGDYWVLVMLTVFCWMTKKLKWWHFILVLVGIEVFIISFSRSALLAFLIGTLFLMKEKLFSNKRFYYFALAFSLILFLVSGVAKTILFSRPYFVQAMMGIFHNPFGVGMGNFAEISADRANHVFGLSGFSSYTHNIVLEALVGMGILGLTFVYWLTRVLMIILKKRIEEDTMIYKALFLVLTFIFLFDISYTIPSMLWLWFFLLGLAY